MSDQQGVIVRNGQGRASLLRHGRGSVERLIDEEVGASLVDVHINTIRAGSAPGPYHLHSTAENVYRVLSGRVRVRIGTVDHDLDPGDTAFVPPGVAHSATNIGDQDAVLLEVYAPVKPDFVEVPQVDNGSEH